MKHINKLIVMFVAAMLLVFTACEPSGVQTEDISGYGFSYVSSARLFYPANIGELDNVGATTLSSGMGGSKEGMYWLAEPLAEAGMVVLAISASDNSTVAGYRRAHQSGVSRLQSINSSHSAIAGKIGDYGTIGYSKGGGGAINAASNLGGQVGTCVGLAPWGASPSSNHSAATMILTGTSDMIAPAYMGKNAYDDLPYLPKLYAAMSGEGHFYWNNRYSLGSETDFITAWLKYYLEGDDTFYDVFSQGPGAGMTDYEFDPADGTDPIDGGCD